MKVARAVAGLVCFSLSGCAQDFRGDADQVYVDSTFALTDAQSIDAANKHCETFGKTASYRSRYSARTVVFACVSPSSGNSGVAANALNPTPTDINLLNDAADLGDANAMFKLGVLYTGAPSALGHWPPNYEKSMLWLRRSADLGNSDAMAIIGASYLKGQDGLSIDPDEALRWFRKAASLGNPTAMYALGMMLDRGIGTPAQKSEAFKWFIKSAKLGVVDAMTMSGIGLVSGVNGQGPNYVEAMHWFRNASDKGDTGATFMIAEFYCHGLGVQTDYAEAMRWALKAAQGGDVQAMKLIGDLYSKGLGVPPDKTEALHWYQMAAKRAGT